MMISGLSNPARLKIYDGNLPKIGYAGFVDTLYRLSRGVNFLCQSAVGGSLVIVWCSVFSMAFVSCHCAIPGEMASLGLG